MGKGFVVLCAAAFMLGGCYSAGGASALNAANPAPATIAIDAQANGIPVRPADGELFVTDDRTNAVLVAHDGRSFTPYATLPAVAGQANGLSQVSLMPGSGGLLIARFGFGTAGAVFGIAAADTTLPWTGIDPGRRRLGLASIGRGRALSTWFSKHGDPLPEGGLSLLTYDESTHTAAERDLVTGLGKPVGIAVSGDKVIVSDQAGNRVVSASLATLLAAPQPVDAVTLVARVNGPDLLAVDDRGVIYTKCNASGFCAIAPDGTIDLLADDFHNARGVAVDSQHHVLYVVDRAKGTGQPSYIRTFAIK